MRIAVQSILSEGFTEKPMFHPKIARLDAKRLLMTVQTIGGSDYYGPVLESLSDDDGHTWSPPAPVPTLGWSEPDTDGVIEGVCDTVPDLDPKSGRLVAVGHSVYYRNNRFLDTLGSFDPDAKRGDLRRRGVYSVRREDGSWTPRQRFDPPEFAANGSFVGGCSQKVVRSDGTWLIPFYSMRSAADQACFVTVYRARFDGGAFTLEERGDLLEHKVGRGLLEPSLIAHGEKVYLTLRAEDDRAYWTESADGLAYAPLRPWTWDDGTPLITSTTQQHWMATGGRLYLFYVRRDGDNGGVMRFRAPLYVAEVDTETKCLLRRTERVVLPIDGDPRHPNTVALSGNYHPFRLDDNEWLVADASIRPWLGWQSITWIARLFG